MLRSMNELKNYVIKATDGDIGTCKDFLFDDGQWKVRYMVADTRRWVPGRKVLLPPHTLGRANWESNEFEVELTKEQIKRSPGIDENLPVSREKEQQLALHFGWDPYWVRENLPGAAAFPPPLLNARSETGTATAETEAAGAGALRSTDEVTGYHIQATDGEIGHVEDLIVDDESWTVRYVVVDTRNILPGKKVLIAPRWVKSINWAGQQMSLDLTRGRIKNGPVYDPAAPINREQETHLYDYYGRPAYWL